MSIDLKQLRADVRGMAGRFFYDAERGDIGWIAKDCDDKQCDCERKLNDDGDQDCSHSLSDFEGEDHICEPIVRMLNAVGPLLDRIDALESALREACNIAWRFTQPAQIGISDSRELGQKIDTLRKAGT